jgi:hypothetical protein
MLSFFFSLVNIFLHYYPNELNYQWSKILIAIVFMTVEQFIACTAFIIIFASLKRDAKYKNYRQLHFTSKGEVR